MAAGSFSRSTLNMTCFNSDLAQIPRRRLRILWPTPRRQDAGICAGHAIVQRQESIPAGIIQVEHGRFGHMLGPAGLRLVEQAHQIPGQGRGFVLEDGQFHRR